MRLRRTLDGHPLPGTGFDALACGLLAVTRVIVGWTKVRQAVVVAWAKVVDRVRAGTAADVADVAVEGEDGRSPACGALPVAGEAPTAVGTLPTATGHRGDLLRHDEALEALREGRVRPGDRVLLKLVDGRKLFGTVVKAGPDGVDIRPDPL